MMKRLDALFSPWNRSDSPGLIVAVARDGVVIYRAAFGMASLESGVALMPKTRMRLGSVSKHFTALLALLLAEEGKLDLDAPIRTYIPELIGPAGTPTARLLLQHRGGARCHIDIGCLFHGKTPPLTGSALRALASYTGSNFPPGEAMIYNNGGYHLVSIAIDRVGGVLYEKQLEERLFAPLGMLDTSSVPSDYVITPGIATMHAPLSDGGWRRGLFASHEIRGEGGIVSTVNDMLLWMSHLRARHKFGSQQTWETLTQCPVFPNGSIGTYALGLSSQPYRGLPTLQHAGGVDGGSAQMLTFPTQGLDIVILSNGAPGASPTALSEQVADIVLQDVLGPRDASVPARDYAIAIGNWWSPETGMMYGIGRNMDSLTLSICSDAFSVPLKRLEDGRVVMRESSLGEMELLLEEVVERGELIVRFGGRETRHRKLSNLSSRRLDFIRSIIGQYRCVEGDYKVSITQEGDEAIARFSDEFGGVDARLVWLGDVVAMTTPRVPTDMHYATLSFDLQRGAATGFRLNSAQTRNLAFERLIPVGKV